MKIRPLFFVLAVVSARAYPVELRPRILSFADENWLTMSVGEWDPAKKWVQSTDFYAPPQPRDEVTLFGVKGKLGEVVVTSDHRPIPEGTNAGWSARIARGVTKDQPFALAIQGSWAESGLASREMALNDPETVRMVSDYLRDRGLQVQAPFLSQAYEVDLLGDGRLETLVCAHSDASVLRNDQATVVYALALLQVGNKTIVLASQAAFKRPDIVIDEFEHAHGKRDFYRFLAFHDIDGDGRKEIVLYRAQDTGAQVDVFTFDGRRARKVLSAYKPGYN